MRVLVGCEQSGRVREAFRARGHDAWSCDITCSKGGQQHHLRKNLLFVLYDGWDMLIAFPPCTHLAVSGARWWKERPQQQAEAIEFVKAIWDAPVARIAIENPVGILSSVLRKPDQIIHPWQFGHGETKKTCLWLKGLPALQPTEIVEGREARVHHMTPSPWRSRKRSLTYRGIAEAMAEQWGGALTESSA